MKLSFEKGDLNMSESKEEVSQKDNDFELWKYYGTIGGNDKDHMIKIVTWLLGLSAGIIGFYATNKLEVVHAKVFLLHSASCSR